MNISTITQFLQELKEDQGLDPVETERATALLSPFADRFYEDALSILFQEARAQGYEVEMLTYASKESMGSPRNVYTDLPRSMGMRKRQKSKALPDLPEVWAVVPNRGGR